MTALSDKVRTKAASAMSKLGASGSLVIPNATYNAGGVTESPTTVAVTMVGPVEDQKRYAATGADSRITATFYIAAKGLAVTPTTGCRITFDSRTYTVIAASTPSLQGADVAYRLDVGEVGSA